MEVMITQMINMKLKETTMFNIEFEIKKKHSFEDGKYKLVNKAISIPVEKNSKGEYVLANFSNRNTATTSFKNFKIPVEDKLKNLGSLSNEFKTLKNFCEVNLISIANGKIVFNFVKLVLLL